MAKKAGRYPGKIRTLPLTLRNRPREELRKELENIPFLGYEVERLADGRTICITKPGGKNVYGQMKIHDFMVWVYDDGSTDRWRISHQEIFDDISAKVAADRTRGEGVVAALQRVHDGEDPEDVLADMDGLGGDLPGESPELLLKAYKWIWGQEDCNYPTKEGRSLSMKAIRKLVEECHAREDEDEG